jgi:hypothetical protein
MADSTWKTYKTAVESFQSFRKLYNLQDTWPAPLYDLLFYIAYMSHTGLSASTITTYISGISTMHKLNGHTVSQRSLVCGQVLCRIRAWRASRLDLYFDHFFSPEAIYLWQHSSNTSIWSIYLSVDTIFQSLWFVSGFP